MSSEVSFGLFGMLFVFWRDVTEVFESLVCRVGRVVRRSIIYCIRKSSLQHQAFSTRQRNCEQDWKKAEKLSFDYCCVETGWTSIRRYGIRRRRFLLGERLFPSVPRSNSRRIADHTPHKTTCRLSIKAGSERYFGQQARRISRVFGHAWFHHREVFEECEVSPRRSSIFGLLVIIFLLIKMGCMAL